MERGVREFQRLLKGELDFIMQDVTKRTGNSLVRLSPVADPGSHDRGEYVADWDAAIGQWPPDTEQQPDPKKTTTRRRLQNVFKNVRYGQSVFFENDDPVVVRLEFGYSKKAPQGIVRLTARRFRGFVKGAGRAAQNKIRKQLVFD